MSAKKKGTTAEKAEEVKTAAETAEKQTETTAEKTEEVKTAAEEDVFPSPCVYCGPSVRGVARQYTTFVGGVPETLRSFIKAHPAARGLMVGVGRFARVRENLNRPGTAEAILYKKIKSEL